MHEGIRAPPTLVCRDRYGGYYYLASAELWSHTSLPFFEDSRQICVLRDPYGAEILKPSAWSRALTTAWSRAYCAMTILADNGSRSRNRGIYIAVFAKDKVRKAPARRISRLFTGVLVSALLA